jgi:tungstate transport system substrate-binding protein
MLERTDAHAVISHAPAAETSALRSHSTWRYRKIMFNDFVIVGPVDDPARVSGTGHAGEAMRRIALSGARFLSRGDQSGTHEREQALWQAAGARPAAGQLISAGAGMGATLRVASETAAYTLTDRASFAQLASSVRLTILHEGDPALLNTYAVIIDDAGPRSADATVFFEWLSGDAGRSAIENYRVRESQVFFAWPQHLSAERPDALPR